MPLVLIGTGRIGCAIVAGLLKKKVLPPQEIIGVDQSPEARRHFQSLHEGLAWCDSTEEAVRQADQVLIAVKPQQIGDALPHLKTRAHKALYLSVAAGITLARLQEGLGNKARIIRAMPNTPALLGMGATAYAGNEHTTDGDLKFAAKLFGAVGYSCHVEESDLDAVTALSGSGPAYFYLFVDLLRKAAVERGLKEKVALRLASQTALGAAHMLIETGMTPSQLIEQVKSPGGTTEAGLKALSGEGIERACRAAIEAACQRSHELSSGG